MLIGLVCRAGASWLSFSSIVGRLVRLCGNPDDWREATWQLSSWPVDEISDYALTKCN
jgi:hypothetical protein